MPLNYPSLLSSRSLSSPIFLPIPTVLRGTAAARTEMTRGQQWAAHLGMTRGGPGDGKQLAGRWRMRRRMTGRRSSSTQQWALGVGGAGCLPPPPPMTSCGHSSALCCGGDGLGSLWVVVGGNDGLQSRYRVSRSCAPVQPAAGDAPGDGERSAAGFPFFQFFSFFQI